jgi:hypothetical protein
MIPDDVIRQIMAQAQFHLCFDCKRKFGPDDLITLTNIGPLIIYHHTACMYPEEMTQRIKEATLEGEIVCAEDFKEVKSDESILPKQKPEPEQHD